MSTDELNLALVQADTIWHDAAANRERLAGVMRAEAKDSDLIVLPETFTTGFSNEAVATAESMEGETAAWMKAQAQTLDAAITGSVQVRVGTQVFNRLLWAMPDGTLLHYDKRHLFRMAGEHNYYEAGGDRLLVDFRGWRICPLVCYDLRFPAYSRNRFGASREDDLDYDLLLYVANWPAPRHEAWRTLLRARAIENLCFVAGVNRAGTDGNGIPHLGGSAVIDAKGVTMVECGEGLEVARATISLESLREFRRRFPAHLDADRFELDAAAAPAAADPHLRQG